MQNFRDWLINDDTSIEQKISEILQQANISISNNQIELFRTKLAERNSRIINTNDQPNTDYCIRDFKVCPVEFNQVENKCIAKLGYNGYCNRENFLPFYCEDAHYPCVELKCKDNSYPNYSALCPLNWTQINTKCMSPNKYSGYCEGTYDFSSFTYEDKQLFSYVCQTPYRCNFNIQNCPKCPYGYSIDQYLGVCKKKNDQAVDNCNNFSVYLSPLEEAKIQQDCNFTLICFENSCIKNYSTCPINWLIIDAVTCINTEKELSTTMNNCSNIYNPAVSNPKIAEYLEKNCNIEFSCLGKNSKKDYEVDVEKFKEKQSMYYNRKQKFANGNMVIE